MPRPVRLALLFALSVLVLSPAASAQDATIYVVSYIEATPAAATPARDMVVQYVKAIRQEPGNTQATALQRIGEPNHFVVVEAWKDKDAQATHGAAAGTHAFRGKLDGSLRSPYDERTHVALNVA